MRSLDELLGAYFCSRYGIKKFQPYTIEYINARKLLVPQRFDLMAKVCYVKAYLTGVNIDWATELYRSHIMAFSYGREPGNAEKKNVDIYVEVFNELIEDIKKNGFNPDISVIPVGKNNAIMDGAHRVAIAIYLNQDIPIIRFPQLKAENGYQFFEERLLDRIYMDYMVLEYLKMSPRLHCACVWPRAYEAEKQKKMEELIQSEGSIVYKKRVDLDYSGIRNLMIQVYSGFAWMKGIESHFAGAVGKADVCYLPGKPMYLYVIEMDSLQHTLALKAQIREIFKIGNHSIHISDTQEEALQIGQMLLNESSVFFLNYGKPDQDVAFFKKIMTFKNEIGDKSDEIILAGDVVLAMYGLKKADKIYYVGDIECPLAEKIGMVSLNELGNPQRYFYYAGLKFTSIECMKHYGIITKEDAKMVDSLGLPRHTVGEKLKKFEWECKRRYRNIRYFIRDWLVDRDLIEVPLKIYHFITRRK